MDDLISRETVRETLQMYVPGFKWDTIDKIVDMMPSTQPERKKGKWIWITGDVYKCSECETETHVDECFGEPIYNYCPYCNAFMDGYER